MDQHQLFWQQQQQHHHHHFGQTASFWPAPPIQPHQPHPRPCDVYNCRYLAALQFAKQVQQQQARAASGYAKSAAATACPGCVNGSCSRIQKPWNKENVGIMRSLWRKKKSQKQTVDENNSFSKKNFSLLLSHRTSSSRRTPLNILDDVIGMSQEKYGFSLQIDRRRRNSSIQIFSQNYHQPNHHLQKWGGKTWKKLLFCVFVARSLPLLNPWTFSSIVSRRFCNYNYSNYDYVVPLLFISNDDRRRCWSIPNLLERKNVNVKLW